MLDDALADVGSPRPPQLNAAWFKMIVTFDSNNVSYFTTKLVHRSKGANAKHGKKLFLSLLIFNFFFFIHNYVYGFKMTL